MSERIQPEPVDLKPGAGAFLFDQFTDGEHQPLTVHYYWPPETEREAPVIFVMHGLLRDGERYRDRWMKHARNHGFLLMAPEFDRDFYPSSADYNLGGMVERESSPDFNDEENWAFHRIELLFEVVRHSTSFQAETFGIYGHSAGAQFVHRLVLFHPEASFHVAVAANAGWYTLPCQETEFPYGISNAPVCDSKLGKALQRKLVVLLGEEDVDGEHRHLRRSPAALEQGQHRLDRGRHFFDTGRAAAESIGVPFEWELVSIPDAAHRDSQMSEVAVEYLLIESGGNQSASD